MYSRKKVIEKHQYDNQLTRWTSDDDGNDDLTGAGCFSITFFLLYTDCQLPCCYAVMKCQSNMYVNRQLCLLLHQLMNGRHGTGDESAISIRAVENGKKKSGIGSFVVLDVKCTCV